MAKIDFERAELLMDIIVKAGQHGPVYQKLASLAGEELKEMIPEDKPVLTATPPAPEANKPLTKEQQEANARKAAADKAEADRQAAEDDKRKAAMLRPNDDLGTTHVERKV